MISTAHTHRSSTLLVAILATACAGTTPTADDTADTPVANDGNDANTCAGDGSDEGSCPDGCDRGEYRCHDGSCIPRLAICNGREECLGGDDELQCNRGEGTGDGGGGGADAGAVDGGGTPDDCGGLSFIGYCADAYTVIWCEDNQVWEADCYPGTCELIDGIYDCSFGLGGGNDCLYAYDGVCDEGLYCDYGTDTFDCYLASVASFLRSSGCSS